MADYDLKSDIVCLQHYPTATISATPTVTATDLLDYGGATFELYVGAGGITFSGTNRIDFIVYESDDNSTFTLAADDSLILDPGATAPGGTGIVRSIIGAHASADTTLPTAGYRGKKRYVKCVPTFGGTHGTGTAVGVKIIKSHPYHRPINAANIEV